MPRVRLGFEMGRWDCWVAPPLASRFCDFIGSVFAVVEVLFRSGVITIPTQEQHADKAQGNYFLRGEAKGDAASPFVSFIVAKYTTLRGHSGHGPINFNGG